MTTSVTNSMSRTYRVAAINGGDVSISSDLGDSIYPPGEDLITAIRVELGLPESPPDVFKDLPDVGEPDSDSDWEYEMPYSYISDAVEARENAQFAYAVYLKLTSETEQKVAKLASLINENKYESPRVLARRLIESGEVTVE